MMKQHRQRGQGLVEFALVFPFFMLILFGVIEVGRFVYTDNTLSQAAREGARLAAVEARWIGDSGLSCVGSPSQITPANPGAHVCPADVGALKLHVAAAVNRMVVGLGSVSNVYLSCNAGDGADLAPTGEWVETPSLSCGRNGAPNGSGQLVSVRVAYQYSPLMIPFIGSTSRSASATMVIN